MYPRAAKPAAITRRRITAQALRLMKPWLMASSVNPRAMAKYHQAKKRGFTRIVEDRLQQFDALFPEAVGSDDPCICRPINFDGLIQFRIAGDAYRTAGPR